MATTALHIVGGQRAEGDFGDGVRRRQGSWRWLLVLVAGFSRAAYSKASRRSVSSSSRSSSRGSKAMVSFWMCETWRSRSSSSSCLSSAAAGGASASAVAAVPAAPVRRPRHGWVVFLGQQGGHVAVAGVGHERKELLLLEVEVAADLLFQVVLQRPHSAARSAALPRTSACSTRPSSSSRARCSSSRQRQTWREGLMAGPEAVGRAARYW